MPTTSPTPCLTSYGNRLSGAERLRCVAAHALDLHAVSQSYGERIPVPMRHLLAERLDLLSGTAGHTTLLRHLLAPHHDEARVWVTLLARAVPAGQRRLVSAFGDSLVQPPGFGRVWTPAAWPFVPPLFPLGVGVPDQGTAWALLHVFQLGVHRTDDTSVPGDLWVETLLAWPDFQSHDGLSDALRDVFLDQSRWFLEQPARLSEAAVGRLLAGGGATLRSWAITQMIPQRLRATGPAPHPPTPASAAAPQAGASRPIR